MSSLMTYQKLFANLGQTVLEPPLFGDRLVPSGDLSNHITVQSCSLQLLTRVLNIDKFREATIFTPI